MMLQLELFRDAEELRRKEESFLIPDNPLPGRGFILIWGWSWRGLGWALGGKIFHKFSPMAALRPAHLCPEVLAGHIPR